MKEGFIIARISAQQQTMATLARHLSLPNAAESPVIDKTGLTGKYDFQLEYAKSTPAASASDPGLPDIFSALPRQLGLQLVPKKLPFDVLVIESFDKTPAEN